MERRVFTGSALCRVDRAGRVLLPKFIRSVIEDRSEAGMMMIGVHDTEPCLLAYGTGHLRDLHADHMRRHIANDDPKSLHARARHTFGIVEDADYTKRGTITVTKMMRSLGTIETLVLVLGVGRSFEIWCPERALASEDPEIRDLVTWRLEHQHDTIS